MVCMQWEVLWLGCPFQMGQFFPHLKMTLTLWNQICFVTTRKVCLKHPEELEHPPVLLITYCDYLDQAESLTVPVYLGVHF